MKPYASLDISRTSVRAAIICHPLFFAEVGDCRIKIAGWPAGQSAKELGQCYLYHRSGWRQYPRTCPSPCTPQQVADGLEHQIEIKTGVLMPLIDQIKPRLGGNANPRIDRIGFLSRLTPRQ